MITALFPETKTAPKVAFSHNGTYTIKNEATNEHRTFKISTAQSGGLEGKRIASLLTGSDNTSNYRGFAFVDDKNGVVVWKRFRSTTNHWSKHQFFADMMNVKIAGLEPARGRVYADYSVRCATVCRVCNRKLTDPKSIDLGIGPRCRGE